MPAWGFGDASIARYHFETGRSYFQDGKYFKAEQTLQQALYQTEALYGPHDLNTCMIKSWLARAFFEQRKYAEAEEVLRSLVRNTIQAGAYVLSSKYWLGRTLFEQKRHDEAIEILQDAFLWQEKVLGPDHENTHDTMFALAKALIEQDEPEKAVELLQRVVARDERIRGSRMAYSKHHLGVALYRQEKYAESEEILRQALWARERALGQSHEDTLVTKHWLGTSLLQQREQHKIIAADEILRQIANTHESILGQDDKKTLRDWHWIGRALFTRERFVEAESQFKFLVYKYETLFGLDHTGALQNSHWLGRALFEQKKYNGAERTFQKVSSTQERLFGPNHENTLSNKHWLAKVFLEQKKYAKAEELFRNVAYQHDAILGKNHRISFQNKHWLGRTLYEQKKFIEAADIFSETLEARQVVLGSEHEHTLGSKYWLGRTYLEQHRLNEAVDLLLQAIEGAERNFGPEHKNTLITIHWSGRAFLEQNRLSVAKKAFQKAALGQERTLGPDHEETILNKTWLEKLLRDEQTSGVTKDNIRLQSNPIRVPQLSSDNPSMSNTIHSMNDLNIGTSQRTLGPRPRSTYTVAWICALPVELAAAQEMLDEEHETPRVDPPDTNIYTCGRIGDHNIVIACLGTTGTNPAAAVATLMQTSFREARLGLMVGIGGGVPSDTSDVRLGDVVVSKPFKTHSGVVQYDSGKTTQDGQERTGYLNNPPTSLLNALAYLQAQHMRGRYKLPDYLSKLDNLPMFKREAAGPDILYRPDYNHVQGPTCESCNKNFVEKRAARQKEVVVHYGTIASGNQVIRDAHERDRMSGELGGVLCFEMEAAGLMNNLPCLVIRGICDYADSHKNKKWQPYAAGTAAAFAKEVLSVIPAADVIKSSTMAESFKR